MGPESKAPNPKPEKEEILRQLGKKFYKHCDDLSRTLDNIPVNGYLPEEAEEQFISPLLREFSVGPGESGDFDTVNGLGCSVTKRTGSSLIEFEYYDMSFEGPGDWADRYLLDENGNILAAEHADTVLDEAGKVSYKVRPLPINPEELLFKIDHEFVPAPQDQS